MTRALIALIEVYRFTAGPMLRVLNGGHGNCRHIPTCSCYGIEALRAHGAARGSWLTARRILRCHPWGTHGFDPVPPPRSPRSSRHD